MDAVYDLSKRQPGEETPQLEVLPITMYVTEYAERQFSQIAVNGRYICYGLRAGQIRVLHKETASRAAVSGVSVSRFEPINALLSTKMSVSSGDAEAKELEVLPEVLEEDPVVSLELPEESRLAAPRSNDDARFLWPFLCVELDSACNTADSTAKRTLGSKLCTSRIPHSQTNQSRNAPLSKGRFGEIFTSRKSPETTASCAPASSGAMKNKTSVFRAMFVTCMRKQSPVIEPNSRAGNRADRTGGVW